MERSALIRVLLFIAALNVPITLTSGNKYFDSDISVQWSKTPASGTSFGKLGINGETDSTSIFARTFATKTNHHGLEDGPPGIDITIELDVAYRVKYSSGGGGTAWFIHFDYYTDGGTTLVRRQTIDVGNVPGPPNPPDTWRTEPRTITGISLTQAETDDLSCRVISEITLGGARDAVHLAWARHNYTYIEIIPGALMKVESTISSGKISSSVSSGITEALVSAGVVSGTVSEGTAESKTSSGKVS